MSLVLYADCMRVRAKLRKLGEKNHCQSCVGQIPQL